VPVQSAAELAAIRETYATEDYGVRFFGVEQVRYFAPENALLGRVNQPVFFMPLDDAAMIQNASDAARYTGMAPSVTDAALSGRSAYGIVFPTDDLPVRVPTAADAGGFAHFLEGGQTAVRLPGPNSGYLVNPTREFVTPGTSVPTGSVLFRIGPNGEWIPMRRF
jgi:hypothetical protein